VCVCMCMCVCVCVCVWKCVWGVCVCARARLCRARIERYVRGEIAEHETREVSLPSTNNYDDTVYDHKACSYARVDNNGSCLTM
jgi:hypothetical protein